MYLQISGWRQVTEGMYSWENAKYQRMCGKCDLSWDSKKTYVELNGLEFDYNAVVTFNEYV